MQNTNLNTSDKIKYDNNTYWCYRGNHFEVIPAIKDSDGNEKVLDLLRLCTKKVTLDKLSGKLSLHVWATVAVVDYINKFDETTDIKDRTFHIKYMLYSDDGEYRTPILDRTMTLTDISFSNSYDSDSMFVRLDFCNSISKNKVVNE